MVTTKQWNSTRKTLKKEFEYKGITTCELRYEGCWINNALSYAHSKKRRFICTEDDLREVALACVPCHQKIERLPHDEMERIVREVIERRK